VRTNEVKRESYSSSTTMTCDGGLAKTDTGASEYIASGWRRLAVRPWSYRMRNDAITGIFIGTKSLRSGSWFTLQRGSVFLDLYNCAYNAPVIGKDGECYGGAIEYYAMLAPAHAARVKPGTGVNW
jgi:hypothetical protein